nr:hypothetical protein [Frankia sp. Cas3]
MTDLNPADLCLVSHATWDDEHIPRAGGLALFDAFASTEKSLHVNAGKHMGLHRFEAASAVRFFERHLRA